jgi:hypothetical protein
MRLHSQIQFSPMINFKKFAAITIFLSFIPFDSVSQDCKCTVDEVASNTVESCNLIIGTTDTVYTAAELRSAIIKANQNGGSMTILIADGTYAIASTSWYPYITASNMVIRSLSGMRNAVILTGQGMKDVAPNTENGLFAVGNNITIADLTIKDVGNHGISVTGEHLFVHNVRIQNTYEQMIKGTSAAGGADSAIVQCSLFEYTAGVGPQFYIGGLDIHDGDYWRVNDNVFKNISSPSRAVAEHAVHFWNKSSFNIVERNWIFNCDRGIGFGLGTSPSNAGIIRNNMIYNDGKGKYADVGISLETSPNTKVYNNTIYLEYPNAIEYRFAATKNVLITNNLTNKNIKLRDGAQASLAANYTTALSAWFEDISTGDLRLASKIASVVDKGLNITSDVSLDINKTARPQGTAYDLGAHEFKVPLGTNLNTKAKPSILVYPSPNQGNFNLDLNAIGFLGEIQVSIFTSMGVVAYKATYMPPKVIPINTNLTSGLYTILVEDKFGTRALKPLICR